MDFVQFTISYSRELLLVGGLLLLALLCYVGLKIRRMLAKKKKKEVRYIVF